MAAKREGRVRLKEGVRLAGWEGNARQEENSDLQQEPSKELCHCPVQFHQERGVVKGSKLL